MAISKRSSLIYAGLCLSFIILPLFNSCNSGHPKTVGTIQSHKKVKKIFTIEIPSAGQKYTWNDSIRITLSASSDVSVDSTQVFLEGELMHTEKHDPLNFLQRGSFLKTGRQYLRIRVFYNDSLSQGMSSQILVVSDKEPAELSFEVVRTIPHNKNDYTQGLFYLNGYLYEGTGREKQSRLIKTDPSTGRVIMEQKLDDKYFGEGIASIGKKIYQLTYVSKLGFIYDLETFELIREFDLQTMQGWGLTSNGKDLILSDGSSRLYFYEPESLIQVNQLDVANHTGLVKMINELEYQDGYIWANLYAYERPFVLKINASTGEVVGRLDLRSLYPSGLPRNLDYVLNGIAYNPASKTYFVTGKFWPVMYEIKISEP